MLLSCPGLHRAHPTSASCRTVPEDGLVLNAEVMLLGDVTALTGPNQSARFNLFQQTPALPTRITTPSNSALGPRQGGKEHPSHPQKVAG